MSDPGAPEQEPAPGDGSRDWRAVTIVSLVAAITLLVTVLLIVRWQDDQPVTTDTTVPGPPPTLSLPTTSAGLPSTMPPPPATAPPSSTVVTAPGPTVATTTTTTTTTTTAPPPTTISPVRCTGRTTPQDPEPVAEVLYDAWRVDDRRCAGEVATEEAIDTLFQYDGSSADWTSDGCQPDESAEDDAEPHTDCTFRYEGGRAIFEMTYGAIGGWEIFAVQFVVD